MMVDCHPPLGYQQQQQHISDVNDL